MKYCTYESCSGVLLEEPFSDGRGSGTCHTCSLCARTIETYTRLRSGAMTAAQFRAAAQPGRPKGARG